MKKQKAKDLHSRIQTAKSSLAILQPELKTMEDQKAKLEAQLAQLNSKIQAHKDKIAGLPESIEVAKGEMSVTIKEDHQLKVRLATIQSSEKNVKKLLANVNRVKTEAIDVIKHYLNL